MCMYIKEQKAVNEGLPFMPLAPLQRCGQLSDFPSPAEAPAKEEEGLVPFRTNNAVCNPKGKHNCSMVLEWCRLSRPADMGTAEKRVERKTARRTEANLPKAKMKRFHRCLVWCIIPKCVQKTKQTEICRWCCRRQPRFPRRAKEPKMSLIEESDHWLQAADPRG